VLRKLKPRLVITTWHDDEHPDHRAAFHLVQAAFFLSRLPKLETGEPFHAPEQLWSYGIHKEDPNSIVVDVSDEFEQKQKALQCYESQFVNPQLPDGYRYAGMSDYLDQIEVRGRYWGQKIGTQYAEAFSPITPVQIEDPF
jgi:LmbE family N-acetylglucosaminyl deacetylase